MRRLSAALIALLYLFVPWAAAEGEEVAVGMAYMDPEYQFFTYLEGGGWQYQKQDDGVIVYYLPEDTTGINYMTLYAEDYGVPYDEAFYKDYWNWYADTMGVAQYERSPCRAGGHPGVLYTYTIPYGDIVIDCRYAIWGAGDFCYTLCGTAAEDMGEAVWEGFDSLMANFLSYEEMEIRRDGNLYDIAAAGEYLNTKFLSVVWEGPSMVAVRGDTQVAVFITDTDGLVTARAAFDLEGALLASEGVTPLPAGDIPEFETVGALFDALGEPHMSFGSGIGQFYYLFDDATVVEFIANGEPFDIFVVDLTQAVLEAD